MNNSLSTGAQALRGVGIGLLVVYCGLSVYSNFTNDNLSTSRKLTDSVVDIGISISTFVGTAALTGSIGSPVGMGEGIAVRLAPHKYNSLIL